MMMSRSPRPRLLFCPRGSVPIRPCARVFPEAAKRTPRTPTNTSMGDTKAELS